MNKIENQNDYNILYTKYKKKYLKLRKMQQGNGVVEYEYAFFNINENHIKDKLKKLGATQIYEKILFKVAIYSHPHNKDNIRIRLRNEENKVTFTIKTKRDEDNFPLEYEVEVNNFEQMDKMLILIGCEKLYAYEKFREKWKMDGIKEIVFDTIPGIPTYMEIEATTKEKLLDGMNKLGFDEKDAAKKRNYFKIYYGIKNSIMEKITLLTFENIHNLHKYVQKNIKEFNEIVKNQQILYNTYFIK